MEFDFNTFVKNSGLKVLSLTDLSKVQHKIILYLLHCAVSGLDYLISNHSEFSATIDVTPDDLDQGLRDLAARNIIQIKYKFTQGIDTHKQPFRIHMQLDQNKWLINDVNRTSSTDALVFPFRRSDGAALVLLDGKSKNKVKKPKSTRDEEIKQVVENFVTGRSFNSEELQKTFDAAEILVDTHPLEQILLMIKHFGTRIESLNLLASSWQHFLDKLDEESHKIDIFEARQKQQELNQEIRDGAKSWLDRSEELKLSDDEVDVLKILSKHQYPRRQLYWAYQARNLYPKLKEFFKEYYELMLSVTNDGHFIKRTDS